MGRPGGREVLAASRSGLGGGQKGNLQRAATARTADGKNGQNVRRHSLDMLNASMIKPKNKDGRHLISPPLMQSHTLEGG